MDPTFTATAADESTDALKATDAQYLVLALDCSQPLTPPARLHLDRPRVTIGRGARRNWQREQGELRIELPGSWVSSAHARITGSGGKWTLEDAGSKNGTMVNGMKVGAPVELADCDVIEVGHAVALFRSLSHLGPARDEVATPSAQALPATLSPSWAHALAILLRIGRSAAPVLLLGATGTGKEVLARAVHTASGRSGPFVPVNCGAIVRTLVESELFGTKKGAFSGATEDRPGLVRSADGGTLFLDEIAELPESSQVALLRVLQERAVMPVGATRALPIDLRVVAATQEDLAARVADGRFRADLHARLAGHVTHLPRLRERIEDVGLLTAELLQRLAPQRAARLSFVRAAARTLFSYAWPYNVRELEQALQSALAITTTDEIALADLPAALGAPPEARKPQTEGGGERERIVAALEACAGNQTRAAKMLGISRATLVNKLAIHRIARPRTR
jgi:DNA-binding NtrC family response regulator